MPSEHQRVTNALEMAWRRRALAEIAYANRSGKPIYRIKNPPIGTTDTGISLMTEVKPFTILHQQCHPTKPEESTGNDYYYTPVAGPVYCIGENKGYDSTVSFSDYSNYLMFCRKQTEPRKMYLNYGDGYPFFTPTPRRVACVVDAEKTQFIVDTLFNITQNRTFDISEGTLVITSRAAKVIDELLVYDRVLTDEEISAYIQYGIVP